VLQIGLGLLVATSIAKIVAVPRTLPAIVMSASDTGGCCSAGPSRPSDIARTLGKGETKKLPGKAALAHGKF